MRCKAAGSVISPATKVTPFGSVAGGVALSKTTTSAPVSETTSSQPRTATYNCADGGMITIENLGASVRVTGADEEPIELPAAPAAQTTRYGEQPYALVLDGRDALFMKSGQEPLACTR